MWKWRMNIFKKNFVNSQNGKHLWREDNCQFTHNKYPENIWKKTWPEQDIKQLLCGWLVTITVEPRLTATSVIVIRSPLYYGPFFWPHGKIAIHFLVKKKPSLIRSPVTTAKFFFWPISDRINGVPLYILLERVTVSYLRSRSALFQFFSTVQYNGQKYLIFRKWYDRSSHGRVVKAMD